MKMIACLGFGFEMMSPSPPSPSFSVFPEPHYQNDVEFHLHHGNVIFILFNFVSSADDDDDCVCHACAMLN